MSKSTTTCPVCQSTKSYEDGLYIRCADCDHRLALTPTGRRAYRLRNWRFWLSFPIYLIAGIFAVPAWVLIELAALVEGAE